MNEQPREPQLIDEMAEDLNSAPVASPGRTLREAREANGLSIADVTQAIKFSARQIEAIEADDYAKLPGNTFVRGVIRSYAKLLRLEEDPLLAMLPLEKLVVDSQIHPPQDTGAALPLPGEWRSRVPLLTLVIVLAAVAIAATSYVRWPIRLQRQHPAQRKSPAAKVTPHPAAAVPAAPKSVAPKPAAAKPATAKPTSAKATKPTTPKPATPEPPATEPPAAKPPAAKPPVPKPAPDKPAVPKPVASVNAPAAAAPKTGNASAAAMTAADTATAGTRQLVFVFEDKSWVEVRDGSKKVIFSRINAPATRQVVTGKPPFYLVIGNAKHVQLQYEGKPVDLKPYIKVQVARLTLP